MLRSLRCCFNPKVVGGLAAVGLVVWLAVPGGGTAALPVLITLICPLSMGIMMWQMHRGASASSDAGSSTSSVDATAADAELAALREELAIERTRRLAEGNGPARD